MPWKDVSWKRFNKTVELSSLCPTRIHATSCVNGNRIFPVAFQTVCGLRWVFFGLTIYFHHWVRPTAWLMLKLHHKNMNGTKKKWTLLSYVSEIICHLHRESDEAPCEISGRRMLGSISDQSVGRSDEFPRHTPSLLACVSTTFRTGMNADVSLKLLLLTMWVWMLRPSV